VVSACRAWLVGTYNTGGFAPLAERWNGSSWKQTTVPYGGGVVHDDFLYAVSARAADDVWAVGDYDHGDPSFAHFTLIERWNGSSWSQVPSPNPGGPSRYNFLRGVAAVSASDAWAVGSFNNGAGYKVLILHWNGSAWRRVKAPDPSGASHESGLSSVTATSATNAWAVGSYLKGQATHTLILHWNGKSWKQVPSPSPRGCAPGDQLASVSATSLTNAWAVGTFTGCFSLSAFALIEHWNGKTWKLVHGPKLNALTNTLTGVTAISARDAWAVGATTGFDGQGVNQTLILHWNGKTWHRQHSADPGGTTRSNVLWSVAAWSSSSVWSVGDYDNGSGSTAMALHCC
jgi:hypothetical protein